MGDRLSKRFLQQDTYRYVWSREKGDGDYARRQDLATIDKREGYEVLYFVEFFMKRHDLKTSWDVRRIEDALHSKSLEAVTLRQILLVEVESMLGL
ncbi:hypothetical protein BAY1663_00179 [Pseudomonas sp. BAY1663]|uniref:hypothetical protein n=1 Tax=Pseudomonas sp. BAY1663 TaxID=1439940 RepID=UPI00042DE7DA|nr:hypothetical protein [Pseudomonas sp. BAY1663]EXF47505.1 hypothetical protein BAY1663_00179 [Pseudomonas sp. BAY1663]